MEHSEGTFSGFGGLELYYQGWRPEDTPKAAVVVVPGFGEHSGRYGNVVNWLVPRGYAVYAIDPRGNGRSPGPRGFVNHFADFRRDVQAFVYQVRAAEPDLPTFLLGHSQGALIVLDCVMHDPEGLAGVIASGPVLGKLPVSPFLVLLAKALSRVWPRFTLETGLDVTALSRDPQVVQAYVDDPLVQTKATARLGTELMAAINWIQAHASDLALPCLIVHGSADRLCPPEGSRTFFENVTFADKEHLEYEGYYHEVFNDVGKEQVLADVEAWLAEHL
jgi:alpha-beta hydrolase superfamily lysophospholipase